MIIDFKYREAAKNMHNTRHLAIIGLQFESCCNAALMELKTPFDISKTINQPRRRKHDFRLTAAQ